MIILDNFLLILQNKFNIKNMLHFFEQEYVDIHKLMTHIRSVDVIVLKKYLKDIFRELGTDHMSKMSFYEFLQIPIFISEKLFNLFDNNSDGKLSYDEFEDGVVKIISGDFYSMVKFTFDFCDFDKDGEIFFSDLKLILKYFIKTKKSLKNKQKSKKNDKDLDEVSERFCSIYFSGKKTINFTKFKQIIETTNSDLFFIIMIMLNKCLQIDDVVLNFYKDEKYFEEKVVLNSVSNLSNCFNNTTITTKDDVISPLIKIISPRSSINLIFDEKIFEFTQKFLIKKKCPNSKNSINEISQSNNCQISYIIEKSLDFDCSPISTINETLIDNNIEKNVPGQSKFSSSVNICFNNKNICNSYLKDSSCDNISITEQPSISSKFTNDTIQSVENKIKLSSFSDAINSSFNNYKTNLVPGVKRIPNFLIKNSKESILPTMINLILNPTFKKNHYENYLFKYDSKKNKMTKIYIVLINKEMFYFKNSKKTKLKGMRYLRNFISLNENFINKDNFKIIDEVKYYCLSLFIYNKQREFYVYEFEELKEWAENLKKVLNIRSLNDNYELISLVHEGKTESIFKAKDLKNNNEIVSIKMYQKKIKEEELEIKIEKMIIEREILSYCEHRNIVRNIDYFEDLENIYIVTEFSENGNLTAFLETYREELKLTNLIKIIYHICEGVSYLHENGIIHRDIKPANIVINNKQDLAIKIIDFNLSTTTTQNKKHNESYGTLHYASPEILLKQSHSKQTDIWSLGVTIYYILFGTLPFKDELQILKFIKQDNISIIFPNYKKSSEKENMMIHELIGSCLTKNPNDRSDINNLLKNNFFK